MTTIGNNAASDESLPHPDASGRGAVVADVLMRTTEGQDIVEIPHPLLLLENEEQIFICRTEAEHHTLEQRAPLAEDLDHGATTPHPDAPLVERILPGYLCEVCLDATAVRLTPAPWGGDMGICLECVVRERHIQQVRRGRRGKQTIYTHPFTDCCEVRVPGSQHGLKTWRMVYEVVSAGTPPQDLGDWVQSFVVDRVTYDVTLIFAILWSGTLVLHRG
jgi:hypothetical protein